MPVSYLSVAHYWIGFKVQLNGSSTAVIFIRSKIFFWIAMIMIKEAIFLQRVGFPIIETITGIEEALYKPRGNPPLIRNKKNRSALSNLCLNGPIWKIIQFSGRTTIPTIKTTNWNVLPTSGVSQVSFYPQSHIFSQLWSRIYINYFVIFTIDQIICVKLSLWLIFSTICLFEKPIRIFER